MLFNAKLCRLKRRSLFCPTLLFLGFVGHAFVHRPPDTNRLRRFSRPRTGAGAGWWDQVVWNAAEALGNARASLVGAEEEMPVGEAPNSREELVERLRADYDRNYFLTGDIDVPLYTEDCEFADPFTSFRGRQRFVQNLKQLGLAQTGMDVHHCRSVWKGDKNLWHRFSAN